MDLYSVYFVVPHTEGTQVWITQFYLQLHQCLPLARHSKELASGTKIFPLGGVQGGIGPPNVNFGPPKISETTRARTLKLKTQLDIVK